MTRNELFLLRHAESVGNATGNYDTADHGCLSERGKRQAREIRDPLSRMDFDRLVVSPTERTRGTIRPFLESSGRTGELWPELSEACWHDKHRTESNGEIRTGETIELVGRDATRFEVNSQEQPAQHPPADETYAEGLDRIERARDRIEAFFEDDDGRSILAVGHAHLNARLIELLLGCEPIGRFEFDNVAMSAVTTAHDGVIANRWVSFSNLDPRSGALERHATENGK